MIQGRGKVMSLIDMVGGGDYIAVSRVLCRALGPNTAVMYSELVDRYKFYRKVGKLDDEGMFFATVEDIKEKTGLSRDQQLSCIKILREYRLISTKRKGIPAKRYILIHENPEFLRVIFGIDNDEARNIQKAEKPTTSYRNSRQLVTGNSDNLLSENQTETNLYNKPKQTENNNVVVELFRKYEIDILPVLKKNPDIFSAFNTSEIETIAAKLARKKKDGIIQNPVGMLVKYPNVIKSILSGEFYPDAVAKKKDEDDGEAEIYSGPSGVRYLPISHHERLPVHGGNTKKESNSSPT